MATRFLMTYDIPKVVRFGRKFYKQSGYPGKFNKQCAEEFLMLCLAGEGTQSWVYEGKDGKIQGLLVGTLTHSFASPELLTHDIVFIAEGSCGRELVEAYEKWAKENKVKKIFLSSSTGTNVESVTRLYNSYGYNIEGVVASKEVG